MPLNCQYPKPTSVLSKCCLYSKHKKELVAVGLMLWVVHLLRFINFLEGCDGPIEQYCEMQCVSGTLYVWIVARACVFHNRCIMLV